MRYLINGDIVRAENGFVGADGTQYTPGWLRTASFKELQAIGASLIVEQPRPDDSLGIVNEDPDNPGHWIVTPFSPPTKEALFAKSAETRWLKEEGGCTFGQTRLLTDAETQRKLTAAYVKAQKNANYSIPDWKFGPNTYVPLAATDIIAIGDAVEAHIQACFTKNKEVDAAIEAGTITTFAQVEAAFASLGV